MPKLENSFPSSQEAAAVYSAVVFIYVRKIVAESGLTLFSHHGSCEAVGLESISPEQVRAAR